MKLVKGQFNLGKNEDTGYLYLKRSFTNVFLTLTDLDHKVIICRSAGQNISGSKRKKKSPYALESMVRELHPYFKLYKITKIRLILKMRINAFFYFLNRELLFYGIKIVKFRVKRSIAFNGVRGRKLRRL